jgi:hypothetical protein
MAHIQVRIGQRLRPGGLEVGVRSRYRGTVALVALAASLGCSGVSSDGPLPDPVAPPGGPPPPITYGSPPPFPAISDAVAIYNGPVGLYDFFSAMHGSSLPTRYVFFRDSTFQMQFASARYGVFSYPGRYSRTEATFTFAWDGSGPGAPWGATGTLRGDTLDIRYNLNMSMSDFFDGPYVLVR